MNQLGSDDINSVFYEDFLQLKIRLGQAERDLVITTDGLSALEKQLMIRADKAFRLANNNKAMPEYAQRRDAKAHPLYSQMINAKARAAEVKIVLVGKIEIMKMRFDAFRTRSADRRNGM
jgi:hypothetical protein